MIGHCGEANQPGKSVNRHVNVKHCENNIQFLITLQCFMAIGQCNKHLTSIVKTGGKTLEKSWHGSLTKGYDEVAIGVLGKML